MQEKDKWKRLFNQVLLGYMTLLIFVVTLAPFQFEVPERLTIRLHSSLFNLVMNIAMFVPLGYLYQLSRPRERSILRALFFGGLVSLTIESVQLFVDGRITSAIDLIANALGSVLGAYLLERLYSYLHQGQTVQVLALHLPLTNVVYLLLPLMWLSGLSLGEESSRLLLFFLLTIFGAGILTSVYRNRLEHLGRRQFTLILAVWLAFGVTPAAMSFPLSTAVMALLVLVLSQLASLFHFPLKSSDRRFEIPTLKILSPIFAGYLGLLCGWPTHLALNFWNRAIESSGNRLLLTFRLLEILVAFTLLGYLIAELRTRKEDSFFKITSLVVGGSSAFLILSQIVGNQQFFTAGNFPELMLIYFSSVAGAIGFRIQLRAFRGGGPDTAQIRPERRIARTSQRPRIAAIK